MKPLGTHPAILCVGLLVLLAVSAPLAGQIRPAARYEGRWEIQANGDVKVTRRFTLPMQLYRMWKNADVHMLELRNFEAGRSNVEVAAKKADWDDLNRTLTLTMTVMGLAQNMGGHWEAKMAPGLEFSNLDEAGNTAYFHMAVDGAFGRVQGQDIVRLPPGSSQQSWNASSRTIRYVLPAPPPPLPPAATNDSAPTLWWVLFAATALAAAFAWGASFVAKARGDAGQE